MPMKDWYIVNVQGCHFRQLWCSFCTSRSWKDNDGKGSRRDSLGKRAEEVRKGAGAGEERGGKDGSVKKERQTRGAQ